MFLERFLGRRPSHFEINPIVKAYIVSEAFLWSAWDFVLPIIAIFISANIPGGNIKTAATGFSIYLISRVVFELISGKLLLKTSDRKKITIAIFGILFLSLAYFGFAFAKTLPVIFLFYSILGMGLGIATPAKSSLFAIHLDKNRETSEWSLTDAVCAISMALATALGGFIAADYGFQTLFLIAGIVNILSVLPYLLYIYPKINMDVFKK